MASIAESLDCCPANRSQKKSPGSPDQPTWAKVQDSLGAVPSRAVRLLPAFNRYVAGRYPLRTRVAARRLQ